MASKFTELAIDCHDPRRLADFWCAVLDYEVREEDEDGVMISAPELTEGKDRRGPIPPMLTLLAVPESKSVKNRLHIDVNPTDREQAEEVERLLDLGARHVDIGQGEQSWVVLTDPEGNEFCVLQSRHP